MLHKHYIAIPVILLLSLTGCGDKKKKKSSSSDKTTHVTLPKPDGRAASTVTENDILSFFDEDLDGYAFDTDEVTIATADDTPSAFINDNEGAISWIETAHQDNGLKTVYFGFNKYGVAKDQRAVIDADAELVKELLAELDPDSIIMIEGHACHSAGSRSYNLLLSEKRAKYVSDLLKLHNVDPRRIKIVGRGAEMPAIVDGREITGSREEQWPNRRVEIRVVETA